MIAHIMGLPIEESALQLVPFGAAMMSVVVIAGRMRIDRIRRWLRRGRDARRQAEI